MLTLLLAVLLQAKSLNYTSAACAPDPPFARYVAQDAMLSNLALPRIVTADERKFRTVLTKGVTKGYGVVDGGTDHEREGVNFGGHYVLVQWGCGSSCMQAALIDGRDGSVLRLPRLPDDTNGGFSIQIRDMQDLDFRWNSRLLVMHNVGDDMRYSYVLEGTTWRLLGKDKRNPC